MKSTLVLLSFFSFLIFTNKSLAQGEAAVPFLLINPSPSMSAMGSTGTALPTDDPFGFLWNPAQLGCTSQTNNLSLIFYPVKLEWIPVFNSEIELKAIAFNAGYNFKDLIGIPISLGFGYSNPEFDFGDIGGKDYYKAYSFGLCVDLGVQLSVGYTVKNVNSLLSDFPTSTDPNQGKAETTVNDFGILLNVPILKLIDDKMSIKLSEEFTAFPAFNFSVGYSKSNIGDSISYIDSAQFDPLPRVQRLGYGISTGFDLAKDDFRFNAFNLSFTVEAEDIMISISSMQNPHWKYDNDFDLLENILLIKGSDKVVTRVGTKLEFAETFSYSFGHFSGRGYPDPYATNGFELRAKGLLKLCALLVKHPITDFLRDHFDIKYYNANYFAGHFFETKMTGLAFYIHNLNGLF